MNQNILGEISRSIISFIIRTLGILLMLAGLWIALQILSAAQELYEHPENIERFAVAIEKGSNIDKAFAVDSNPAAGNDGQSKRNGSASANKEQLRLSYFCAWVIWLLLMLLITKISLTAIKIGGELALFDTQIKLLAKNLVKESHRYET